MAHVPGMVTRSAGMTAVKGDTCSFCGISDEQAALVPGPPSLHICAECLDLCNGMLAEENVWREALRHLNVGREIQKEEASLTCSFCGKSHDERKLIAGPAVYICGDCVRRCTDVRRERE